MIIGVIKEIMEGERRVSAIPDTVKKMVADGHEVLVEVGAGVGSYFLDDAYEAAGATLVADPEEVYRRSDLILKVKEPQFNHDKNKHEVDMMHEGQYLITFLHPAAPANHSMINDMAKKGIIGLTLDGVPRISRAQTMDALSSMSACAGYKGMIMAIDALPKFVPMIGSAVGMIKPATVLVIGTGVAGLRAVATARSLGAVVYSADIRPDANEQAKSLGAKIVDLNVPEEVALSADGKYANQLPKEYLLKERETLKDIISKSDIVYLSALVPGKIAPILITDEMVKLMKPGSVIVDVSIDQGGNCSLTEGGKRIVSDSVIIDGIKNIPGMIPTSSTWMFAHNIYNLLNYLVKDGKVNLTLEDEIVDGILVTMNNKVVHKGTLEAMSLK